MKKNIAKNIAMPPKIFGAPLMLAATNLSFQIPIALLLIDFSNINPLYIVFSFIFIHLLLVLMGLIDPHLDKKVEVYGKTKQILIDKYDLDNATLLFKDNSFVCVFKMDDRTGLQQMPAQYMKYVSELNLNLRTVNIQNTNFLIVSGIKNNVSEIIKQTNFFFSNIELLTKNTRITPVDVIKSTLNPISSASVVEPSYLSEKSFIVNQRRLFKKGIMLFEHGGQKLYATVLSLSNLDESVDFESLSLLKQRYIVSSWILPCTSTKALFLLGQRAQIKRLQSPFSTSQMTYLEAMKQINNGEVLCKYGVNIYISASSIQQLELYKKEAIDTAQQHGLTFVEETYNLPFAFYIGLPQYEASFSFLLPLSTINI